MRATADGVLRGLANQSGCRYRAYNYHGKANILWEFHLLTDRVRYSRRPAQDTDLDDCPGAVLPYGQKAAQQFAVIGVPLETGRDHGNNRWPACCSAPDVMAACSAIRWRTDALFEYR